MQPIKGLEWTFNTVASAYEKLRPGYAGNNTQLKPQVLLP